LRSGLASGETITIPPGGNTNLSVVWIINELLGQYSKGVTLATNDPDQPKLVLRAGFNVTARDSSDRGFLGTFEIDEKPDGTYSQTNAAAH
jgi:hypothetical protein